MSAPDELLPVAEEAARTAGALLRERFENGAERRVHAKSTPTDLASAADLAAEEAIRELLAERRPGDAILAEEGGGDQDVDHGTGDDLAVYSRGNADREQRDPIEEVDRAVERVDHPLKGCVPSALPAFLRDESRVGRAVL